jgi:hypothetical protein
MTTRTRNDPWNAWNLWTALIALLFFGLWLVICPLGLFGQAGMTASLVAPTINALASSDITTNPVGIEGMGAPNSSLQLRIGDKIIGPIAVGADGKWSTKADLSGLSGKLSAYAEALADDGKVGASSAALELNLNLPKAIATFDYPSNKEQLDTKDYALSGLGTPGDQLEIWQTTPSGTAKLGTILVGADGRWNSYVPTTNPGTKPGTYTYSLRRAGSTDAITERTVIVKAGLTEASNAKCPCRLRIFTNLKQNVSGSKISLFSDGRLVDTGTGDKLFTSLSAGEYTYSVTAPGYQPFTTGKATLPKNKNFEVYLKPKN